MNNVGLLFLQFQTEMLCLVEQRQQYEIIDETILRRLSHLLLTTKKNADRLFDKNEQPISKSVKPHSRNSKIWNQLKLIEGFFLENLVNLHFVFLRKIQQNTDLRGELIGKMIDDFKKEQLIWNKMIFHQLETLKKAER